jgi:hypothetical protein
MRTRSVEWLLSCLMLTWGVILLAPSESFANPAYRWLAALGEERVWGALAFSVGALRIGALYINGSWRRTPLIRAFGAVMGLTWWVCVGALLIFGVEPGRPLPAGFAFYPVFALFEAYSCYRSGLDARESDALRRR